MKTLVFVWIVDESNAIVLLWVEDCQLWRVLRVISDDGDPLDKGNTVDLPLMSGNRFASAFEYASALGGNHDEPDIYEVETPCVPTRAYPFLN